MTYIYYCVMINISRTFLSSTHGGIVTKRLIVFLMVVCAFAVFPRTVSQAAEKLPPDCSTSTSCSETPPPCPVREGKEAIDVNLMIGAHARIDFLADCAYPVELDPQSLFPQANVVQPFGCRYACANFLRYYTVKCGDTLWDLLIRWKEDPTDWGFLASINKIVDPKALQAGAVIIDLP